jgi:hypothetical protein
MRRELPNFVDEVSMVQQEHIDRIREEEILRMRIRQELGAAQAAAAPSEPAPAPVAPAPPSFGQKLMEFLNSSLGMWLLSSVVLTGGAALIQQVQHDFQIREQNHRQLVNHVFEINNRLDNMEFLLRRATTVGEAKKALEGLFKSIYPLTPELQNRSLSSLYFTVYSLIPSSRQNRADEAIELVRQLADSEYALQSRADDTPLTEPDRAQFEKLIRACKAVQRDITVSRSQ